MGQRILITSLRSVFAIKTPFIAAIRKIFFDNTSRKSFADENERKLFFESWTSYYFDHHPDDALMAFNEKDQLLGYLTGCMDSKAAVDVLATRIKSFKVFEDQFDDFPAHLHINTSPRFQGQGIGGMLIDEYVSKLKEAGVIGVHIVTTPDSRNTSFYRKHGFTEEIEREFEDCKLLFMGRKIT